MTSFAEMDEDTMRRIASAGGRAAHEAGTAHEWTPEEARAAGRLGGQAVLAKRGRDYYVELGKRGGAATAAKPGHMARIGRKGGTAVSVDREQMREIGRAGGRRRPAVAS